MNTSSMSTTNRSPLSMSGISTDPADIMRGRILRLRIEREFEKQKHKQSLAFKNEKLKKLTKEFRKREEFFMKNVPVRQYTPFMKSKNIPTYLLLLQANVLRSLHQICVLDIQQALVERQCSREVKKLRKEVAILADQQTLLEVKLLTGMASVKSELDEMQTSCGSVLSEQENELNRLHHVLHPESDSDDELDEIINRIAEESVMAVRQPENTLSEEKITREIKRHVSMLGSFGKEKSFSSSIVQKPAKKKLTLGELLGSGEKHRITQQVSVTDITEDETVSIKSISVKMTQSFSNLVWSQKTNNLVSL